MNRDRAAEERFKDAKDKYAYYFGWLGHDLEWIMLINGEFRAVCRVCDRTYIEPPEGGALRGSIIESKVPCPAHPQGMHTGITARKEAQG